MKLISAFLLSFAILSGFAQQSRQDQLIPVSRQASNLSPLSLEAKFTADKTQGAAPLTVQFTDQSTGSPISWKWTFGDGDSSLLQNPVHVYSQDGLYTVKLFISDGSNGYTLEKKDFIRVMPDLGNCDTLRFPLPEPLTYYIVPDKGYVTGNNSYGDKAVSDYFVNTQPNLVITGVICEFSKARQAPGNNEKILVKVWKNDGQGGIPGTALSMDTMMLSTLVNDVAAGKYSTLDFNSPVQPGGSFYVGILLPTITGDTLCLWSTQIGKLPDNTTWILQSNNVWESVKVLWTSQGEPDFVVSSAIYPKICLLNGIDSEPVPVPFAIWPNPAKDWITIVNQQEIMKKLSYSVYNTSGMELLRGNLEESLGTVINISDLKPGIYIIKIDGKSTFYSARLLVQ